MSLALTLRLLTVTILGCLALFVPTATAQVEVRDEEGGHCPAVTLGAGHAVSGGCDILYESEVAIPLVAYVPGAVVVSNCNIGLSARIDETGTGYVTDASLTNPGGSPGCTRARCDEADGRMVPWPIQIVETAAGVETVESSFCMRTIASGAGGPQSVCEVHLPFTQSPSHRHEFGDSVEYSCESAPVPTSLRDVHFVNDSDPCHGTADIELVH